jgi:predicted RNA-binding Zn-ribbon protein involved in translation (DUF1610 family)
MSDLWLDGNGVAGLLAEVFDIDMTGVQRGCQSCGKVSALGAHRAYQGAGMVLRCPNCGDVGLRIAVLDDRHVVHLAGSWLIELPR